MTLIDRDVDVLTDVETLVREWLDDAAGRRDTAAARRLADVLRDPAGLDFTVGFVDRVIRPDDHRVAAANLRELARTAPGFLPWHLRRLISLGATLSLVIPGLVIPIARKALRSMVGHLLVDATDRRLGPSIARIRKRGVGLNINLLGEAVLGRGEAQRRLDGTERLLARPDVDYVSIKVSATVPPHSPWAFDEAVDHVERSLLPLFTLAATSPTKKFINLDMEEYRDLEMTIAVFTRLLDRPELVHLEAGIVLQAYLPDALSAMMRLQEWASARRGRGGAGIKVRLVKGANLPMEHVEADLHGWPVATWPTKQDTDTNYKRVLDYALHPDRTANVRIGVAGHNLFDIAYAWVLAGRRGVRDRVDFEMLLGMAEAQAEAVRRTVGGLLLYVPVVHPKDFDAAIAYLVRRLEEGASQDNFMSAVFDLHDEQSLYERERDRFVASLAALDTHVPQPNRRQDRRTDEPADSMRPVFANVADSDPSLPGNRAWGRAITERIARSQVGLALVEEHTVTRADRLESIIAAGVAAGDSWSAQSGAQRAAILRRAAGALEAARAELLEVMAAETGKTLDQGDPEVSEAIDFANYYAHLAENLDDVDGAVAVPVGLTVVTPPWNFPVAIPAGSTLAALAAGSAVIIKPATQARRCGSVMVQALWDAGVPRDVLQLVHVDEGDLGSQLISDPRVGRLILTGAFDTAALFRRLRPDLPLLAETSGKNAMVITPHADIDLAVKDLVASAFGHAGQKCSAASLAILVGSAAHSARLRNQLMDAVTSLTVGYPSDPTAQMGPVIEPADGKLLRALTTLGPGEQWLVEPRRLDDTGRLWSPGVKTGVRRGSEYHLTEYFGPVLGLMEAADLDEAIAIQNEVDYGLTAGLHSLDRAEIERWIDAVEAGNAYVNRSTVGAIVRRQPFGGWKKSAVGAGTKAGGPNYLVGLTDWRSTPATRGASLTPVIADFLSAAAELEVNAEFLQRSLTSDALAWEQEFGVTRDVTGLAAEKNVLRYRPVPVTVRAEGDSTVALLRVVAAGVLARSHVTVSTPVPLESATAALLHAHGVACRVEDTNAWRKTLRDNTPERVRLLGGSREAFAEASDGRADIALYAQPVVEAGRIEMLTFLREQAVSVTAHRFGSPTALVEGLFD
ncbi:bifunctional proline dehydrogenase/L-glutamate gamma-semialdehyde dehydrogenase [Mycobacterium sp. PSTR-4-N]|uniref:bifunctional proline dehydrogenase/L-glutamate gamma-semialdehyde dehydrogenase n=1 Tax=Mycobacterium sp. PSTR-4-N TaxID=2917745 RepID=UPI001F14B5A8|nr:bifunctional proline dehydrogenase/L-glutamate gamma-semialdehyde dehydrogenase [Mycobacterium sp. PSTR-4-N]MCG7596978.1 bifunctional proline dehydrogenase/L-glutamate gamma-semialdehyde dehydrogenase [Mycobacterium sp. PSTR-4-N]